MFTLIFLLQRVVAVDYGEYRMYADFGGVYYDYSGNSHHAINGSQVTDDSSDASQTDRGAFFDGTNKFIILHNSVFASPTPLSSSWYLSVWTMPMSSGSLFIRKMVSFT